MNFDRFLTNAVLILALFNANALAGTVSAELKAQFIDSYDSATGVLTIPLVQVDTKFYRDVKISIASVESIGAATATSGVFDFYNSRTGVLSIPIVRVGDVAYYNVNVRLKDVLAVGGEVTSSSVPADLSSVNYPVSYTQVTSDLRQVNLNPCFLDISHVTTPQSWMGNRELPTVKGAPLNPGILRGVNLKDIGLQPGNPAFILPQSPGAPNGCAGDLERELTKTMVRLKILGTDYVAVTQWVWATNDSNGGWKFTTPEETFGALTDSGVDQLVRIAHAAGLKVMIKNQIQGFRDNPVSDPNAYIPLPTEANLRKFYRAFKNYASGRAPFYQRIGVDFWELGCSVCMYHDESWDNPSLNYIYKEEYLQTLQIIKTHFGGKLYMTGTSWLQSASEVLNGIDMIQIGGNLWNVPTDLEKNLSAERIDSLLTEQLFGSLNAWKSTGKQLMLSVYYASRENNFSYQGHVEESGCTPDVNSLITSKDACIQRSIKPDFGLQAIAYEGTFRAIKNVSSVANIAVELGEYWETDSLMPFQSFPHIANSFRNKPAEGVIKSWFAR